MAGRQTSYGIANRFQAQGGTRKAHFNEKLCVNGVDIIRKESQQRAYFSIYIHPYPVFHRLFEEKLKNCGLLLHHTHKEQGREDRYILANNDRGAILFGKKRAGVRQLPNSLQKGQKEPRSSIRQRHLSGRCIEENVKKKEKTVYSFHRRWDRTEIGASTENQQPARCACSLFVCTFSLKNRRPQTL